MNHKTKPASHSRFQALDAALLMNSQLRALHRKLREHDPDLARQVKRAGRSVALNLGEGQRRVGKDRLHLFRIAAGSADEIRVGLQLAIAWEEVSARECEDCFATIDRVLAMTWKLTRR